MELEQISNEAEKIPGLKEHLDKTIRSVNYWNKPVRGTGELIALQIKPEEQAATYIYETHRREIHGSGTKERIDFSVIIGAFRQNKYEESDHQKIYDSFIGMGIPNVDNPSNNYSEIKNFEVSEDGMKVTAVAKYSSRGKNMDEPKSITKETEFEFNL